MINIYYSDTFLKHDTGNHPESAKRLDRIINNLKVTSPLIESWQLDIQDILAFTHSKAMIEKLQKYTMTGKTELDPDTKLSKHSLEVALNALKAGCQAVKNSISHNKSSLCLIRPPGHHATDKKSMGFCLFNNIAVAANFAIKHEGISKILIIDWDVHHGNGTQDIFYNSENVFYFSIHRHPFYPGTGLKSETGTDAGLGYNLNIPLEFGVDRHSFIERFKKGLETAVSKSNPELVLISAGFDAHKDDPIGSLGLESEDFYELTKIVLDVCSPSCKNKIVSFLEGGYNPDALSESINQHILGFS